MSTASAADGTTASTATDEGIALALCDFLLSMKATLSAERFATLVGWLSNATSLSTAWQLPVYHPGAVAVMSPARHASVTRQATPERDGSSARRSSRRAAQIKRLGVSDGWADMAASKWKGGAPRKPDSDCVEKRKRSPLTPIQDGPFRSSKVGKVYQAAERSNDLLSPSVEAGAALLLALSVP